MKNYIKNVIASPDSYFSHVGVLHQHVFQQIFVGQEDQQRMNFKYVIARKATGLTKQSPRLNRKLGHNKGIATLHSQ